MIGTSLAHYTITAKLGEGGMGEVYRAEDTRLKREVAIKVLPESVAADPERLDRFEREAHLLAALNHPNIAAIYGLEKDGGHTFLVLELVEGEDLQERLERGPVPVDDALEVALQIAGALEEAHNRGIVHRDLKPANVKLTPDGKVKVLDFGLAKAWSGDLAGDSHPSTALSQSPTMHYAGTVAGVILGTAAYMSPEQARGKAVDKRADVWAFGVLLWEILTGQRLYPGETVTDVIAAVLTRDADLGALPDGTPPAVGRLIERCLRKDPRSRLPDIGSARLELQEVLAGNDGDYSGRVHVSDGGPEVDGRTRLRERMLWAALAVTVAVVTAFLSASFLRESSVPGYPVHFSIDPPSGWSTPRFDPPVPSPDGTKVVFMAQRDGSGESSSHQMLWLRSLESETVRPVSGPEGGADPFWAPNGRFIGFIANDELRKINLENGVVETLCRLPRPGFSRADWNEDGTILFSNGEPESRIYSVAASGGVPRQVTDVASADASEQHYIPQFLPGGRRFLFHVSAGRPEETGLYIASLDAPEDRQQILSSWFYRRYVEGRMLFSRDGTLYAQPFDMETHEVTGEEIPVVASAVGSQPWSADWGVFEASPGGTLAFISGSVPLSGSQLAWVDRTGSTLEEIGRPAVFGQIALAPDDRSAAVEIRVDEGEYDLWTMDLERGVSSRLTVTPGEERDPVWSSDGLSIAFLARGEGGGQLRRKSLRTGEPAAVVANSEDEDIPESWSTDGKTILVVRRTAGDEQSVWAVPADGGGEAEAVLNTGFRVDEPQLSPDGRWLAYVSPESETEEVYVEPYRREGLRVQVSVAGGGQPKWRSDGGELFYTTLDGRLMAVDVRDAGERLEVSLPEQLFELSGVQGPGYDDYAVGEDGQRFLVKLPIEDPIAPRAHIVTNWPLLLEQ
jgi:serine/threonine protein kinase